MTGMAHAALVAALAVSVGAAAPAAAADPAAGTAAAPAAAAQAAEDSALKKRVMTEGSRIWGSSCISCHAAKPTAGAPFGLRVASMSDTPEGGMQGLFARAIDGVPGWAPMPPRGGVPTLSDDEVKAAAAFMLWMNGGRGLVEDWLQTQE